jgi:hypothetical protein
MDLEWLFLLKRAMDWIELVNFEIRLKRNLSNLEETEQHLLDAVPSPIIHFFSLTPLMPFSIPVIFGWEVVFPTFI